MEEGIGLVLCIPQRTVALLCFTRKHFDIINTSTHTHFICSILLKILLFSHCVLHYYAIFILVLLVRVFVYVLHLK